MRGRRLPRRSAGIGVAGAAVIRQADATHYVDDRPEPVEPQ
ncbi:MULTISPECIES: hypothetical protein [Halorubrum]|nr:hypothetical protein [Halorubrum persicum]